ncbi:hypothetical protein [Agrobacterium larrymoorei]|uniref:Glycosyltransferase family 2 protein n=1 Tax=Agrobacterium larrymoorei TaxID=160699 RepID=A0A4D7DQG8_9HYPH|nr:hypothetical protein [Agrobacterium larrymoorei]QCI98901.1 hypothetical protein CFBP5473_13955 [Agrobacterium larrymoorei]QYA08210.1 hypothetical protein J5285_05780 [Agrobacterium larrymoorei]WHA41004.1 hypothetical protein CFBP5477_014550 [Agrobacterium larrymoorei]
MKYSILIRGNNFLENDRFGLPLDGRNNIDSLIEKLIDPVRAASPGAKIYLATYDSPALAEIQEKIGDCETILLDAKGSSQAETYKAGLKTVFERQDCDALIVSRFDLDFRKSFDAWNVAPDDTSIFFPWREYRNHWRDHYRVGDAVHIIGKKALGHFHDAVTMCQLAGRTHLHLLYYYLRTMRPNLRFIEDGYWDSNTIFANPECENPLYRIQNRPRIPEFGMGDSVFLSEIRA